MAKKEVPDYLFPVLSTICCCMPLGLVSIVYTSKAIERYRYGDDEGAEEAAEKSKKYALWSAVSGFTISVFIVIISVLEEVAKDM